MSMTCRTLFSALRKRACKLIQRAQKTHMSIKVDYKCHSLFGKHRKTHMSSKIGHAHKVYMSSKIDLKSRTLFGLGTDRRCLDFLSYFKTLSLGRMNSSFAMDRHGDKNLFFISLLLEGGKGRGGSNHTSRWIFLSNHASRVIFF